MIKLTVKCNEHPTYKAIQRPLRSKCEGCWTLFAFINAVKAAPLNVSGYTHDAIGALDGKRHTIRVLR